MDIVVIILTIVRLTVPFTILRWPLFGILLSSLVDLYDWQFTDASSPEKLAFYQSWDKTMDLYYLFFIFFIVFKLKDSILKKTAIFLFLYRLLGVFLFYLTQNREMLLFFPNIFENLVIFYLLYVFLTKDKVLFKTKTVFAAVLLTITIPKIIHEYFMHYLLTQPWDVYDIGMFLGTQGIIREYINYIFWGGLFYVVPMLLLLLVLIRVNRKK